jgi:transposase
MNLTENERGQIIGLYKNGVSKVKISKVLGFPRTTVIRTIQNFEERGNVKSLLNSGRPKILNNIHPENVLINLIESMPRRIQACIENNGWPTKY